jgi:hypothetical protein
MTDRSRNQALVWLPILDPLTTADHPLPVQRSGPSSVFRWVNKMPPMMRNGDT